MRRGAGSVRGSRGASEDPAALAARAVRWLAMRERSEADLRARLTAYGAPDAVEAALAWLRERGYVSDRRFTEAFTEHATVEEGMGARRLRAELARHGVDATLREAAERVAAEREEEGARRVVERLARRMGDLPPEVRLRRIAAALARRGFRTELVVRLAREAAQGDAVDATGTDLEALAEALAHEDAGEPDDGSAEGDGAGRWDRSEP